MDGKRIIVRETSDSDTLYVIFLWSLEISFNHMQCICVVVMKCWWNNPRREPQGQNDNSPKFATGIKFIAFLLNYRDFAERRLRLFSELFQYFFTYPMNRQWYIHVLSIYHMYPISEVSRSFYCQFGASWRTKWTWLEWLRRSYDIIVATGHSEECVQPGALGNGANSVQLEKKSPPLKGAVVRCWPWIFRRKHQEDLVLGLWFLRFHLMPWACFMLLLLSQWLKNWEILQIGLSNLWHLTLRRGQSPAFAAEGLELFW